MRTNLIRFLVLALAVSGLALLAQPADASCMEKCKLVDKDPFCYRCVNVGYDVGAKCVQRTPCFCYYEECTEFTARSEDSPLAQPAFLAPQRMQSTEARPASRCAGEAPLLQQQPAA